MIPTPKLDDRTYADIVSEAIRLIPRYCPDWTNHNPSDPGITILELCSWMTELILYRLNRVPEKNYLTFLDMLGIKLQPAQPARALLTFELADGIERQILRKGMQVSTPQADEDDAVLFETMRDLTVVSAHLDRCFSYFDETYSDNSPYINGERGEGFLAFAGAERVDRFIYLGDDRLLTVNESTVLRLRITAPEHGGRDLSRLLEWEYWNGRRWRELTQSPLEVERGEVIFAGVADMQVTTVNGVQTYWLRGRLAEVPKKLGETEVDTVRGSIEVLGEGILPDQAFANLDNNVFIALDLGKNIHPFGNEPKIDHCLYLSSQETFSQVGVQVEIDFHISDPTVVPPPRASDDMILSWEYFDGKKWRILGKTTPRGKAPPGWEQSVLGFVDGTNAFTKSGVVKFMRPPDLAAGEVTGEPNYWIRVRIELGDYGVPGAYMLDGDKWVWRDERPLRPPAFKNLGIRYQTSLDHLKYFVSYNDFRYRDHSEEEKNEYRPFQPFQAIPDEGAAVYLGWSAKLPNEMITIYMQFIDGGMMQLDYLHAEHLSAYYAKRDALWEPEQRIVWEYFNGKTWAPLVVNDSTKNFSESGFIDFVGPDDHDKTLKFTEDRYWIRARLEMGGYIKPPRVRRILQNTVEAANVRTVYDEILGSSDGTPLQSYTLLHGPLLDGQVIEVREREEPMPEDVSDLGENPIRLASDREGGYMVRWREVESFFESGPKARHYVRDPLTRQILFGDGIRGMVPPQSRNTVIAKEYRVGGGTKGNVNALTLTSLTRAVPYIEKVYNVLPAVGGADAETVDQAKERAPLQIKSRDRAVTAEDFETLALRSTTSVARAKALPSDEKNGHVQLVLVPRGDEKNLDLTRKLVPPPELCRFVRNYLDERRLITTILDVTKPSYIELSIKVTLIRRTVGQSERLRIEIEQRLRKYLHPLVGGRDGKGWQFGRPIYRTDLVHIVEDIPGVEAIDSIAIYDEDRRVMVESVKLTGDELPHVINVAVIERVRQEIDLMLSERELPQRRLVRVPDVVGLPLRKALLLVQQAGLRASAVLYKESYEEKDTVLEQKPQRGQMVYASEDVSLWVSRDSYIKWLPAIYQRSDATGRNVVRDLLWIIQHLFGSIEQVLETIHLYFDSYETPEHFLPWLAGWSAMLLEPDWPVNKKRRLIKKAMELYRLRGTVKGLKLFISLFTGFEPHLAENEWPFQGFRIGASSTVGIDTVILPPVDKAYAFVCVMPHQFKDVSTESIVRLHEIIEMEKPAHTTYMLKFEEQRQAVEEREFYRIGISSGINVGQEVVTPLPLGQTGEPELPQEDVIPEQRPEPSVYELFGTKKRLLPPVEKAPKADNAPVEGKEITTNKYGFDDAAREFKLDDIMRELLARAGVGDGTTGTPTDGATTDGATDGSGKPGEGSGGGEGGSGGSGSGSGTPSGAGGAPSGAGGASSGAGGASPGAGGASPGAGGASSGAGGASSGAGGASSGAGGASPGAGGASSGAGGASSGAGGASSGAGGASSGAGGGATPGGWGGSIDISGAKEGGATKPNADKAGGGDTDYGRAGGSTKVVGNVQGKGGRGPKVEIDIDSPADADIDYGLAGGSNQVVGHVTGGGGRGPKVEIDVDPVSEFEGILADAEAKNAGADQPSVKAETVPAASVGRGLAGLNDAPTAILGGEAAAKAQAELGVRRSGGPRIEVEVVKQEIERDAPTEPTPGQNSGPGSGTGASGKDDSSK